MMVKFKFEGAAGPPKHDGDFLVPDFTVLFDDRERRAGWTFQGLVGNSRQKYRPLLIKSREIHMVTADYTVDGYPVYIERKSHDDLIGSCTAGIVNLEKEFGRMLEINQTVGPQGQAGYCCVVAETSLDRLHDDLHDPLRYRPHAFSGIMGVLASWPRRFGVPIFLAGTRRMAEELGFRIMEKYVEHANSR